MAKSIRHQRAARLAARSAPDSREYETTDSHARPDARGHFAGVPARREGGKLVVRLTDKQAKFYLMQGSIRPRGN